MGDVDPTQKEIVLTQKNMKNLNNTSIYDMIYLWLCWTCNANKPLYLNNKISLCIILINKANKYT